MAAVTVTGSLGGAPLSFFSSYSAQAALAAQIFAATGVTGSIGGPLTSNNTIDLGAPGSVLFGTAAFGTSGTSTANVVLGAAGSTGQIYLTGTSADSVVTTSDNSGSSVVNNNPLGNLVATTGAGGNVLLGLAGGNNFTTGPGGQDIVFLNGASNTLLTQGSDAVLVGGPSTIRAATSGSDNVLLTAGTNLAFINGSRAGLVDTITGAANSAIILAGTGQTSVVSGAGPEAFFVDTSAGNTTLNGNLTAGDTFTFQHDATVGTAAIQVNNFTTADAVNVTGYSGVEYSIGANSAGSAVLALTDGSTVTFNGVSAATLATVTKPI